MAPLFDARRDRVYTGLFEGTGSGEVRAVKEERVIPLDAWLEELKELDAQDDVKSEAA